MTDQSHLPHFAEYRLEVVRRERLLVFWNDERRWLDIDIARDMSGKLHPYVAMVDLLAVKNGLFEDVFLAFGDSLEEALAKGLSFVGTRAEVVEGVRVAEEQARTPRSDIPAPDERPRRHRG